MFIKYLSPNQRLVVKKGYGCKLLGPGTVFGILLQEVCVIVDLPQSDLMIIRNVRTAQELAVNVNVQVTYQIDFKLLTQEIINQIPKLKNERKWEEGLKLRLECIIRRRCASYTWNQLCDPIQHVQLQNDARNYLDGHMLKVGIRVTECLVRNVSLPPKVQEALIQNVLDSEYCGVNQGFSNEYSSYDFRGVSSTMLGSELYSTASLRRRLHHLDVTEIESLCLTISQRFMISLDVGKLAMR